ncbi:MAG: DNA recombination protein RmuC [Lentimicrobiaceae bacterium]|nr:DNA recombination protein RmuC [Lentimicrobiaceae bacterium]MCP4909497.1 DNA recombination protein RmuC [Bacteroidota bacterium]MBT3455238.1 DNA recombination protein RmuC [Lentimicrobiaceae bacterium]MBT3818602.1 DNA recombination protein RmuC [Lentimicrobiaceae bacterium]MBT4061413.1 DNA recombination protein RmuC [Lentimicrobiaceae bacterium]
METYMLIISIILLLIILAVLFMRKGSPSTTGSLKEELEIILKEELQETRRENRDLNTENRRELNTIFKDHQDTLLKRITELNKQQQDNLDLFSNNLNENLRQRFNELSKQQNEFNKQSKDSIKDISESIEKSLKAIREDNSTQLNEMRKTVDEKLQSTLEKRLGESFKLVSERLELVHRGLGKMQELASDVGDLQKVLNNVKTRGILGEYQLGNILEQILSPEQYSQNVATKKGSQANVEFAINLPGKVDDNTVWLPIDSKFPIENYQLLIDAYDLGDKSKIELAQKSLLKSIELFAKTISEKYIDPPQTTDFAIMFLPVESLYAEILKHPGTFEKLQREYHITVTGPTTLSALLNSLQMGFRTLAVQKRSSEVWKVLSGVKTEFNKFSDHLAKVHKQINTASGSLDTLINTRTNAMERKLKSVESMDNSIEPPESFELPLSSDINDES